MLETLDHTIRIGSTPTFLYFDLYLYSAYAAHYVYYELYLADIYYELYCSWKQDIFPVCGLFFIFLNCQLGFSTHSRKWFMVWRAQKNPVLYWLSARGLHMT